MKIVLCEVGCEKRKVLVDSMFYGLDVGVGGVYVDVVCVLYDVCVVIGYGYVVCVEVEEDWRDNGALWDSEEDVLKW